MSTGRGRWSRRRFLWAGAVTPVFALLGGAACGGDDESSDDDDDDDSDRRPTRTPTRRAQRTPTPVTGKTEDLSLFDLLAALPDTPDSRTNPAIVNNYARARDLLGIDLPPDSATSDDVIEYATAMIDAGLTPSQFSGYESLRSIDEWRTETGFSFELIDADAQAGEPPEQYHVLAGRFDPEVIAGAFAGDPLWSPLLEEDEHEGVTIYRWGEELKQDLKKRSVFRPLGRGDRVGVSENVLFRCATDEGIELVVDATLGKEESLGSIEEFRALAEALEEIGVYSAAFLLDPGLYSLANKPELDPATREQLAAEALLVPFEASVLGAGADDDGGFIVVAVYNSSEEDAETNRDALQERIESGTSVLGKQPLANVLNVASSEVVVEGNLTIGRIYTDRVSDWRSILFARDTLLLTE